MAVGVNWLFRYMKLTLAQVYQEGLEDLNYIQNINPESQLAFTIHLHNMRLLNFIMVSLNFEGNSLLIALELEGGDLHPGRH